MGPAIIMMLVLAVLGAAAVYTVKNLIFICAPNEVLIFSGRKQRVGNRTYGYRVIKGGRGVRVPLFEKVDKLDLTNMAIEVTARNAYSKGGVPLTVHGVANVKVAGHEPVLNNAIERFLTKNRREIMQIAKATLEGALRGVLATLTPEEVNEDRILFAERLVQQVEQDMTRLGLVVDTLKIQNVADDSGYLDSIGRKKNAEVLRRARIAEAVARADAVVRAAENKEREVESQVKARIDEVNANARKQMADVQSMRGALVAEEKASIAQMVAQAQAEIEVQKARVEKVKNELQAEVIEPAKANCAMLEAQAKGEAAPIMQNGKARADVLLKLADSWRRAGPNAQQVFMLQKLDKVIETVTDVVADTKIDQITMIDSRAPNMGDGGSLPVKALSTLEQVKHLFGVDLADQVGGLLNAPDRGPGGKASARAKALPAETTAELPRVKARPAKKKGGASPALPINGA